MAMACGEELSRHRHTVDVAELLPSTIVAYAEARHLGDAIELVRNHSLKDRIFAIPAYEAAMQSGGWKQLQMGIAGFEATMGQPWYEALAALSDGSVCIGLDRSGAVAALVRSSDEKSIEELRNLLLAFLPKQEGATSYTALLLSGETLQEILEQNRQQLIASNMLSKGHNKQEAEAEIGLLLELADFLESGQVNLDFDEKEMTFSTKVQVQ